ncbi:hypothetical protein [Ponticoccus alexandrii]|uniref:Transcription elongation factor GreA/GreB C-terminal domain-containing protein n=1 Tax=Ponticoccus alexandrii TaxID=1943633 RepID=A0ABX7F5F0_9RHOB|nr:hypothetical protein [Ponticoccus alexandrii]ETA50146.1 hypothetical protein P279_21050 [Rhodobacteraceae bacterium PD-2]QRF65760.1 hypothetical protein GQA70_05155 [Ponticoccus alexandrii]
MTTTRITQLPTGRGGRPPFRRSAVQTGFRLTIDDRLGIEQLLRREGTRSAPNPPLLNGLLRHKLRISRGAPEPVSPDLAVAGRHVTYMISGEGARTGVLSMNPIPGPGYVPVASLLGATLIGMRKLQKVPLLRDDGQIDVVVVLDVKPSPVRDAT